MEEILASCSKRKMADSSLLRIMGKFLDRVSPDTLLAFAKTLMESDPEAESPRSALLAEVSLSFHLKKAKSQANEPGHDEGLLKNLTEIVKDNLGSLRCFSDLQWVVKVL